MIEWDDKYCFGISIIDKEHRGFIDAINKVTVAKEHRNNRKEISGILSKMSEYAQKHFKTEETYMERFGYLDYPLHKKEHQEFSLSILRYRIKLINGNLQNVDDIIKYLQRWLVKHIQNIDRKYTECFNKNALK